MTQGWPLPSDLRHSSSLALEVVPWAHCWFLYRIRGKKEEEEGFPGGSAGKESACNEGDLGSIPGLGRFPGEAEGYPLQYSGLKNIVHGVAKSRT